MNRIFAVGAFILSVSATSSSAQGVNPVEEHSAQCFVAMMSLTSSTDPSTQESGYVGSTFFAGQLFGIDPKIDLVSMSKTEISKLTPETIKNLSAQCINELTDRAKQIKAVSQMLEAGKPSP